MAKIEFENFAGVDTALVTRIVEVASLPTGELRIIAGAPTLTGKNYAECVPRFALPTAGRTIFRTRLNAPWDCGIALGETLCASALTHPAYFAQVLGHELGHAQVILLDPDLHVYCSFIEIAIGEIVNPGVSLWHELPHERAHDRFGNHIAEKVFGRLKLDMDLQALSQDPLRSDQRRLKDTRSLRGSPDLSNLRTDLISFARPLRAQLVAIWDREFNMAAANTGVSITQYAPHIQKLF